MKSLSSRVSFVIALSLYFTVLESALPHPLYFRYGFAYIPLLVFSKSFSKKEWSIIVLSKIVISAVFSLSLFSVGFVLTFFSSVFSGIVIYFFSSMKVKNKYLFSSLGVSVISAFVSTLTQFFISYLLLFEKLSLFLLTPLLVTSLLSSVVCGIIALALDEKLQREFEDRDKILFDDNGNFTYKVKGKTIFTMFLSLLFIIIFVFISAFISPEGEVLGRLWIFTFAKASLINATIKASIIAILFLLSLFISLICIKKGNFSEFLPLKYYLYFLSSPKSFKHISKSK